jgi:hypothetical protein
LGCAIERKRIEIGEENQRTLPLRAEITFAVFVTPEKIAPAQWRITMRKLSE